MRLKSHSIIQSGWAAPITVPATVTDGMGKLTLSPGGFAPRQAGAGLTFTYRAPAGGLCLGALAVTIPAGWTPPIVAECAIDSPPTLPMPAPGTITTSTGTISVSGQTITVADITLEPGRTMTITYSNVTVGGSRGTYCFAAHQKSTRLGTLKPMAVSPSVTVGSPQAEGRRLHMGNEWRWQG